MAPCMHFFFMVHWGLGPRAAALLLDCWWCAWYCLSAPGPSDVAVLALAAVAAVSAGVVAVVHIIL